MDDTSSEESHSEADEADIEEQLFNSKQLKARRSTLADIIDKPSDLSIDDELMKLEKLCCFFAASTNRTNGCLRTAGVVTWFVSLGVHFSHDVYTSIKVYGNIFLFAQVILCICLITATAGMAWNTLPWLEDGIHEMRFEKCYEKTICKTLKLLKLFPYVVIVMGMVSSALQMAITHVDLGFYHEDAHLGNVAVYAVRYVAGCHVYSGYTLFWLVPSAVMMLTGSSMAEFMDQMHIKMKDRDTPLTFKEAINVYSRRANFLLDSSNNSHIVLSFLILTSVVCFGLNAYIFLFGKRHFLPLWHAILPAALMLTPLSMAAWVTQQYFAFIVVVVRAWVIDELDDDDDDEDDDDHTDYSATLYGRSSRWKSTINSKLQEQTSRATSKYSITSIPDISLTMTAIARGHRPLGHVVEDKKVTFTTDAVPRWPVLKQEGNVQRRSTNEVDLAPWMAQQVSSGEPAKQDAIKRMENEKETITKQERSQDVFRAGEVTQNGGQGGEVLPKTRANLTKMRKNFMQGRGGVTPLTPLGCALAKEDLVCKCSNWNRIVSKPSTMDHTTLQHTTLSVTAHNTSTTQEAADNTSTTLPFTAHNTSTFQEAPTSMSTVPPAENAPLKKPKVKGGRKHTFNFERFLTYLENMRLVVGFKILNAIVTWDLVSTIIFLLFSIVAVFVQESLFGSAKHTHP